jgi:hypothetical protein
MNADIIKTQIFQKIKYDLKGQQKSQKGIFKFQTHLFLRYISCLNYKLS